MKNLSNYIKENINTPLNPGCCFFFENINSQVVAAKFNCLFMIFHEDINPVSFNRTAGVFGSIDAQTFDIYLRPQRNKIWVYCKGMAGHGFCTGFCDTVIFTTAMYTGTICRRCYRNRVSHLDTGQRKIGHHGLFIILVLGSKSWQSTREEKHDAHEHCCYELMHVFYTSFAQEYILFFLCILHW